MALATFAGRSPPKGRQALSCCAASRQLGQLPISPHQFWWTCGAPAGESSNDEPAMAASRAVMLAAVGTADIGIEPPIVLLW